MKQDKDIAYCICTEGSDLVFPYLRVMLLSLFKHNSWVKGDLVILTCDITPLSTHNREILESIVPNIKYVDIDSKQYNSFSVQNSNRAELLTNLYRINAFSLHGFDFVMYISSLSFCISSIAKLFVGNSDILVANSGTTAISREPGVSAKNIAEFNSSVMIISKEVLDAKLKDAMLARLKNTRRITGSDISNAIRDVIKLNGNNISYQSVDSIVKKSKYNDSKFSQFKAIQSNIAFIELDIGINEKKKTAAASFMYKEMNRLWHSYNTQGEWNSEETLSGIVNMNAYVERVKEKKVAHLPKKTKVPGGKIDVNSHLPEFGYELISILPYCYHLYKTNRLGATSSGLDTECLYFFNSDNHTEVVKKRGWKNMPKLWKVNFPNIKIHAPTLDWDKFTPPPLKEFYIDKKITFKKETIVICNRYNLEWNGPPINYLDIETLKELFDMLKDEYQIIYINLKGDDRYYDDAPPLALGDFEMISNHYKDDVMIIQDIVSEYSNNTYNEIQLRIFAGCSKFITSNGGQAILASYFGGENIIFTKKCRELLPEVNSFYRWYHKFGNSIIKVVNEENELIEIVKSKWINKDPLINILIRTSGRPNYFKSCIDSIYNQTYKNWNIIVGVDDKMSEKYIQPHSCIMVSYNLDSYNIPPPPPGDITYGIKFKYNIYLNELHKYVQDGYIMYVDDDDSLYDIESLENISSNLKNNDLVFWRVSFPGRLVPSDDNFSKEMPIMKDMSGIGFIFRNDTKEEWEGYKRGDYRIAKKLFDKSTATQWVNETFTRLQRVEEDGFGRRDDKK